jgi:uncharacterized protein YqgQ
MKNDIENKSNTKYKIKIEKRDIEIKLLKKEVLALQSKNMLSREIILKLESVLKLEINSIKKENSIQIKEEKTIPVEEENFKEKYILLKKEFSKLETKIKLMENQDLDSDLENQSDESEIDI